MISAAITYFKERPRKLRWLVLLLFVFALAPTAPANAGLFGLDWGDIVAPLINGLLTAMTWVFRAIGDIAWAIAGVAARFLSWVLVDLNQSVGFVGNDFVQIGWAAVRDFANWFFVIFFLIAAIGTILDLPRYNARQILPKLLIIAVLVNFSLWITGFAVNVANAMMSLIIVEGSQAFGGDIGLVLANHMGIAEGALADILDSPDTDIGGGVEGAAIKIGFQITRLILAGFTIYIFAYLALLLIARIVVLWITMILSPLAFVLGTFPKTTNFFSQWSKRFFDQTIFGVIASFFIFLAVLLGRYIALSIDVGNIDAASFGSPADSFGRTIMNIVFTSIPMLMSFTVIFVFLYLAMKIAKDMSGEAGEMITKGAKGAIGVAAIVGTGGAAMAARGGQFAAMRTTVGGRTVAQRAGDVAARVRGGGRIAERIYGAQTAYDTGRAQKQASRNLDKASNEDIKRLAKKAATGPAMDRDAEIARQAMSRGIKLEWDDKKLTAAIKKLDRFGEGKTVAAARPDLAAKAGILKSQKDGSAKNEAEAIKKHFEKMSSQDFARIQEDAFESQEVVDAIREGFQTGRLDGRHLGAMARRAQDESSADRSVNRVNQVLVNMKPGDFTGRGQQTLKYVSESPIGQQFYQAPRDAGQVAGRDLPSAGQGQAPSRDKFGKRDSGRVREAKSDNDQTT